MPYQCNSQTQLRCVIHPSETDSTYRFHISVALSNMILVTEKAAPWVLSNSHSPLLGGFLCLFVLFLSGGENHRKSCMRRAQPKNKKSNTTTQKKSEGMQSILDKYLLVYAPAIRNRRAICVELFYSFTFHILGLICVGVFLPALCT